MVGVLTFCITACVCPSGLSTSHCTLENSNNLSELFNVKEKNPLLLNVGFSQQTTELKCCVSTVQLYSMPESRKG